jgi:signal transduction histidine kinase
LADDIYLSISNTGNLAYYGARVELVQTVLQEQAKLISHGTLAAELAHELNNPAAAVSQIGHTVCILVLLLLQHSLGRYQCFFCYVGMDRCYILCNQI